MLYRRKSANFRPREAFLVAPAGKMPHLRRQGQVWLELEGSSEFVRWCRLVVLGMTFIRRFELAGAASVCDIQDVLITDELRTRPPTKTDYWREKLALQDLAAQMADHPADVLPRLVALAMELCEADSAGISLYEAQSRIPRSISLALLDGSSRELLWRHDPARFQPMRQVP